ncbi:MAG TPA: RNA methyltransferase [Thermoanaerobaculia bacterium]|jgi:TrmH family RNA methyltransferase|nr:RNA methyltransferase [Thermoanaerobaculia bacterium]
MRTVSSKQNPLVKRIREAIREHAEEIVIEGPKAVADAIASGWKPIVVISRGIDVTESVFDSLSETRTTQGVLGLFERPVSNATAILARRDTIAIALDGVQDPGNVGTIVRLAAAFDASGVLLLPGSADAYGPKAIRSSAGAILNVPVAKITRQELIDAGVPLVSTAMSGSPIDPPALNAVLVFGNEGAGVSEELLARSTQIAIAMSSRVESLNVATSAAILLARSYAIR